VLAEQSRGEHLGGAPHLWSLQHDRPAGGFHGHGTVPVARPLGRVRGADGALIAFAAEEFGHLGLKGGLHEELGAEAGNLFQYLG
jgi:hypothetical protein